MKAEPMYVVRFAADGQVVCRVRACGTVEARQKARKRLPIAWRRARLVAELSWM